MSGQDEPRGGKDVAAARQDSSLKLEINAAIDRGVAYIRRRQLRDGGIAGRHFGAYKSGETAFCAYALAQAGAPDDDAALSAAVHYLREHPPAWTYSAGAAMLLLAEVPGGASDPLSAKIQETIVKWERSDPKGTWGYPHGQIDVSNVQFAALGLWAGHRMGLEVPLALSKRVVEATVEAFMEEPRKAAPAKDPASKRDRRSRAGPKKVAGFHYAMIKKDPPRGSMTVAALCVNRILQRIHGRKLGGKATKVLRKGESLGMGWLQENFSFTENPGQGEGNLLYYLWSVERLAFLTDQDKMFGRDWYREGALTLLELQKDNGSWDDNLSQTALALLFLSRATSGGRPVVTGRAGGSTASIASEGRAVGVRVAGSWDIQGWLESVEGSPHIAQVEWLVDNEVVATVQGDPEKPWSGQRYPFRRPGLRQGAVMVVARLSVVYPDAGPGEPGSPDDPDIIESQPVTRELAWPVDLWVERADAALRAAGKGRVHGAKATASSEIPHHGASSAVDGFEASSWRPESDDQTPTLTLTFERATRVSGVSLSHAAASVEAVSAFNGASRVRILLDGENALELEIPDQSPEPISLELPKPRRARAVEVQILETAGGPGHLRGFAEVVIR